MSLKVCSDCGEEKDLSNFYKRLDSVDGYRSNCKSCQNAKNKPGTRKYQSKESSKQKAKIVGKTMVNIMVNLTMVGI